MGKTKIKPIEEVKIEEEITPVVASPDTNRDEAISNDVILNDSEESNPDPSLPVRQAGLITQDDKAVSQDDKKEVKETAKKEKKSKAAKKIKKIRSKKYQEALAKIEKNQKMAVLEAVKQVQANSITKFDGTIQAHANTNARNLRGLLNMPFAQGKKLRILAFGDSADKSGADIVGSEEVIAGIDKGKIDFDVVVTTPEWMPKLAKLARILGPRGLMPNPKNGTISENLEKAVAELQGGKTEYKTEKDGQVIHLSVGKVSQKPEEIVANIKVVYNTVGRSKISKISLSPTMGPSVKVDLQSL